MSGPASNPFTLIAAAARGDLLAQRALARAAFDQVMHHCSLVAEAQQAGIVAELSLHDGIRLAEGLVLARMAASHGEAEDKNLVLAMLSLTKMFLPAADAVDPTAEMVARAALMAEAGEHAANEFVDEAIAQSPEVAALSQEYRKLLVESEAV